MAAEVECKIMDMTVEELLGLAIKNSINISKGSTVQVVDSYWEISGQLIRFRKTYDGLALTDFDLTCKGKECGGSEISNRNETIIKCNYTTEADIISFLNMIGAKKKYVVYKERTFFNYGGSVKIHHDVLKKEESGMAKKEWVEFESSNGSEYDIWYLVDFLDLNIRVSKKTTLEIMKEIGVL